MPLFIDSELDEDFRAFYENNNSGTSATKDSFGRGRVSMPYTLFDSKLLGDNRSLFWDDQAVSGTGTSSTYTANKSSVLLAVSATTAGRRVRQTKQRFNYQPGKSLAIFFTGVVGSGASGITKSWGYFDDKNGVFFQNDDGVLQVVKRSYTSGAAVDTKVTQSSWNLDKMDGTGESGITLDLTKSMIFVIDIEWLGVGSVRYGVVVDGVLYYVHQMNHSNVIAGVYMTTPNLPIRFEIENDGTGAASDIEEICCTVISEGGSEATGITRYKSTEDKSLDAATAGSLYGILGIRLKTTHLDNVVKVKNFNIIATTNDDFEWQLVLNPTVGGVFTYADETNSPVQTATGSAATTITGGTRVGGGYGRSGDVAGNILESLYYIGSQIDGTRDEMVLCVRSVSPNADFLAGWTWSEGA